MLNKLNLENPSIPDTKSLKQDIELLRQELIKCRENKKSLEN